MVFLNFRGLGRVSLRASFAYDSPARLVDVARAQGYTIFADALELSELTVDFFTAFAPTDADFLAWFEDAGLTLEDFLADGELLDRVIGYHLMKGARTADDLSAFPSRGSAFPKNIPNLPH